MATKKEVQKRRVRAQRQAEIQAATASRQARRRRLLVGAVAGVLVIAMVATLGAGLLALSEDEPEELEIEPVTAEDQPVTLRPTPPGASISGETPCPATDGTQERTTSFETPPPECIDPATDYSVTLRTVEGEITVAVDTTDFSAANLFVTNAWYGLYDDVPFRLVIDDGFAIAGGDRAGDPGFTIPAEPAARPYGPGDVLMWADETQGIGGQLAVVSSPETVATLNEEPVHPVVGSIIEGRDVFDAILARAGAPGGILPVADVRIDSASVDESPLE